MNLEVFCQAIVAEAQADAEVRLSEAAAEADRGLAEAHSRAEEMVDQARSQGAEVADRETVRARTAARRGAREQVLAAQREAFEELRKRAAAAIRDSGELEGLIRRLEETARGQLGTGTRIDRDSQSGGIVARADGRAVDYRIPALVDRAIEELGNGLQELWQ